MNANYQASEKLDLDFGVIYNKAEGGMEGINLLEPFTAAGGPLKGFYSAFEGRISLVEDYSDLDYQTVEVSVGGTYDFTDSVYTTAMLTYSDFDSDEDYVFGDESGEAYYGYVGVGVRF